MEMFITLLGSSTFLGIITVLINWVQQRKNNSLNYIMQERKEWREKIRNIAIKIGDCQYEEVKTYLNQLRININPYGMESQHNYQDDGHIWKCIKDMENAVNIVEFIKNKRILLEYLSLLLKQDWELTKMEIKGYCNAFIHIGLCTVQLYIYIYFISSIF